jgi:urease accessory protein UreF
MNLEELLNNNQTEIINAAFYSLERSHLKHYDSSAADENWKRLATLFDLTSKCIKIQNLIDMIEYSEKIANERYKSGFDLIEVYTAYNVLEEEIWKATIKETEKVELAESLGLVSTVLGKGKETLAATYVSLSSKSKIRTLDLSQLFKGV